MYEIIVSHYKEDLGWLQELSRSDFKITIYNKYEGENLLPNVGRESHTYLTHIVNHYENLADVSIFLQGNPIEHCKDLLKKLESVKYYKYEYLGLSDGLIMCDGNGRPHCGGDHLPAAKLYEWLFDAESPEVFVCNSAGQFAVTRDAIKLRSKAFYEKALKTLDYDINPIEGYCFERMWSSIFGYNSSLKRSDIQYEDDTKISKKDYFEQAVKNGEFLKLGKLGPYFDKKEK